MVIRVMFHNHSDTFSGKMYDFTLTTNGFQYDRELVIGDVVRLFFPPGYWQAYNGTRVLIYDILDDDAPGVYPEKVTVDYEFSDYDDGLPINDVIF